MSLINVVGGSGFIGTRLCSRLNKAENHEFSITDKQASKAFPDKVRVADVRSLESLRAAIPESSSVIINLAAEHRDDVRPISLYDEVNVDGARNICAIAEEKSIQSIIFTSTVAVYGVAEIGTTESGEISPFNDYGRTKSEAEGVFEKWQAEDQDKRTLVIIRPTVIFGEQNRGNVYNLLHQVARGHFVMIGDGANRKSMAYVENIAAFIEYAIRFRPGIHRYNYIDKPDFTMNELVSRVKSLLGMKVQVRFRLPYILGYTIGLIFDVLSKITKKKYKISSVRVQKFCMNSVYATAVEKTGFVAPVSMADALDKTVEFEFLESNESLGVFYSE